MYLKKSEQGYFHCYWLCKELCVNYRHWIDWFDYWRWIILLSWEFVEYWRWSRFLFERWVWIRRESRLSYWQDSNSWKLFVLQRWSNSQIIVEHSNTDGHYQSNTIFLYLLLPQFWMTHFYMLDIPHCANYTHW